MTVTVKTKKYGPMIFDESNGFEELRIEADAVCFELSSEGGRQIYRMKPPATPADSND